MTPHWDLYMRLIKKNSIFVSMNNKLIKIFLISLFFQIVLSSVAHNGDMTNFIPWGESVINHGTAGLYSRDFSSQLLSNANYPPLMIVLCVIAASILRFLQFIVWELNMYIPLFPN